MRLHISSVFVLVLGSLGVAHAQETTTGSLTGAVADAQGAPVAGATVTLGSDQGPRIFTTDAGGRFFAPFLTPGTFRVKVEREGFLPVERTGIEVHLGQRVDLQALTLKVAQIEESVDVVDTAPVVDTSSTTRGGVLDRDLVRRLPVGRRFTDALYLIPGVGASGIDRANPSIAGASGLENSYFVDGVNITDAGYGAAGGYSLLFGSLGNGVTADFVKETQVMTGGFAAEFGQATGGVVNVVTRSGSNAFHGSVFGYARPDALESAWRPETTVNGTVNTIGTGSQDFGVTAAGPVVKDALFYFGAVNPQFEHTTLVAPAGFPLGAGGAFDVGKVDRKRRTLSYAGKLSWQATPHHHLDFTAFGDPARGENGPQRPRALRATVDPVSGQPSFYSRLDSYGGHNQVLKYDGIVTRSWLVEASVGRSASRVSETPSVDTNRTEDTRTVPYVLSGGIGYYERTRGTNLQLGLKSTHVLGGAGRHQVRYGITWEDIAYHNQAALSGPPFVLPNGMLTTSGASVAVLPDDFFGTIYNVFGFYGHARDTTARYTSVFAQDTWRVGPRLTLQPGLRYEKQDLVGNLVEYTFDANYAPRLGVTWDVTGRGRSKVYLSFGRFYAKIPNDLAVRALSAPESAAADYFDAALTQPIPEGTPTTGGGPSTRHFILYGASAAGIDPRARSTYQQEVAGGVEVQVGNSVNLGARYVHRTMPRILEDIGSAPVVAYDLGLPGLESVEYFITNPSAQTPTTVFEDLPPTAFEDAVHRYDAIEVTANKAFSGHWSLLASYRWSRLQGNFEGFFRNDNGQSDPAISSIYDFPMDDPSYTSMGTPQFGYGGDIRYLGCTRGCGVLPNDRTHQVKLYGAVAVGSWNLGLGVNAGSGGPLTSLSALSVYGPGEIPNTVRGGGFLTRDGFRTRASMDQSVDLHADYTVRRGEIRFIGSADVFNLFDRRAPLNYDTYTELDTGVPNPDFGAPSDGGASPRAGFQAPRGVRLGARVEW